MKKDIEIPIVENVWVAIRMCKNKLNEPMWDVYVLNNKTEAIEGVLVSSRGYGSLDRDTRKTDTFRHFLDVIESKSAKKIEPITEEVFGINNEYWLSFFYNGKLYDKKYIFLSETIIEEHLVDLPILNEKGVIIK